MDVGAGARWNIPMDGGNIVSGEEENDQLLKHPYLHDDIIFNIIIRIPPNLLWNNFMYQCKQWTNLFSDQSFIAGNFRESNQGVIFIEESGHNNQHLMKFMEFKGPEPVKVHELHRLKRELFLLDSCNGLLLGYNHRHMLVINPVTKKAVTLPSPRKYDRNCYYWPQIVFAPNTMDCKVVTLYINNSTNSKTVALHVHNILDGSEKRIHAPAHYEASHSMLSSNGVLYWESGKEGIASFDISTEAFHLIPLLVSSEKCVYFINIGGSLAYVQFKTHMIVVCVLKDINMAEWVQLCSIDTKQVDGETGYHPMHVVGCLDEGNLFVFRDVHDQIGVYDIKTKRWTFSKYKIRRLSSCRLHVNSFYPLCLDGPCSL